MKNLLGLLLCAGALGSACGGDDEGGGDSDGAGVVDGAPAADARHDQTDAGPPVTVTLTTYDGLYPYQLPFVAGQDGDGPWFPLSGSGGVYSFDVTSGRYGVAINCEYANSTNFKIVYATVSEGTELAQGCVGQEVVRGTLDVTISNFSSDGSAVVSCATVDDRTVDSVQPIASFGPLIDTVDVVGTGRTSAGAINRVFIRRNLAASDSLAVNLGAGGAAPVPRTLTVNGGETLVRDARLHSVNGTTTSLINDAGTGFAGFPVDVLLAREMHEVEVENNGTHDWTVRHYFHAPINVVVDEPPVVESAVVTVAETDPYVRPTLTFSALEGTARYVVRVSAGSPSRDVSMTATAGWLGSGTSYTWTMPDFSAIPAWNDDWALAPGAGGFVHTEANITEGNPVATLPVWVTTMPLVTRADWDGLVIATPSTESTFTP